MDTVKGSFKRTSEPRQVVKQVVAGFTWAEILYYSEVQVHKVEDGVHSCKSVSKISRHTVE